ncbi:MAG TPA: SprT-like domain-containing protein [Planctomycetota bacterium]
MAGTAATDRAIQTLEAAWPQERMREVLDAALVLWKAEDLRAVIRIEWNPRLRTTLGRAVFEDMKVELNPRLLARHPGQMRHVLVHESAHLVVQRLYGVQPAHGGLWKAHMRALGESTRATHTLDVGELARSRPARRTARRRRLRLPRGWLPFFD